MTIQNNVGSYEYIGNGVTKEFPFPSKFFANTDILVYLNAVLQASGYVVSGRGVDTGGNVTFITAPASGVVVSLVRFVPYTSDFKPEDNNRLPARSMENSADKSTLLAYQAYSLAKASLRVAEGELSTANLIIPPVASRANKSIKFDLSGNVILTEYDPDVQSTIATEQAAIATAQALIATNAANSALESAEICTEKKDEVQIIYDEVIGAAETLLDIDLARISATGVQAVKDIAASSVMLSSGYVKGASIQMPFDLNFGINSFNTDGVAVFNGGSSDKIVIDEPFKIGGATSFAIYTSFIIPSDVLGYHSFVSVNTGGTGWFEFNFNSLGQVQGNCSSGAIGFGGAGSAPRLSFNTRYWIKIEMDGTNWRVMYSTDGVNYAQYGVDKAVATAFKDGLRDVVLQIGKRYDGQYPLKGTVYIGSFKLEVNGVITHDYAGYTPQTIQIKKGNLRSDDDTTNLIIPTTFRKKIGVFAGTWVQGDNQNGLDIILDYTNSKWLYGYAIYNPTTKVTDVMFTDKLGAPTLPSGFTKKALLNNFAIQWNPKDASAVKSFARYTKNYEDGSCYYTNYSVGITLMTTDSEGASQPTTVLPVPPLYGLEFSANVQASSAGTQPIFIFSGNKDLVKRIGFSSLQDSKDMDIIMQGGKSTVGAWSSSLYTLTVYPYKFKVVRQNYV